MSELTSKIRSRGHWEVIIAPTSFVAGRIEYSALWPTIQRVSVNLRGWDFPHVDPHVLPLNEATWVGQESEWHQYKEAWRFFQSGQFVDLAGLWEDWLDESALDRKPEDWQIGQLLGVTNTIHRFTEIYEFASKLMASTVTDEPVELSITLFGLENRRLYNEDPHTFPFMHERKTSMKDFPFSKVYSQLELLGQTRELALEPAIELFKRFDWNPTPDLIGERQARIGKW